MQITQVLRRTAQLYGRRPATLVGDGTRSWEEVAARVARLAGALRGLGLAPGGRVAMLALNGATYLEYYFAVPWAGGCVVPINHRLAPPEIAAILADAGAEILIADEAGQRLLPAGRPAGVRHLIHAGAGEPPEGWLAYEQLIAAAEPVPDAMRGGEELAGLFYTSGTTGRPKGVMLSHGNLVMNAMAGQSYRQYVPETVFLHAAPMFHTADLSATFPVTMAGGCHGFLPRFDALEMMRMVETHRVTATVLVPTMIRMLATHPDLAAHDLSSLRAINYGGSIMPTAVLAAALKALPDCRLAQAYGLTETSPIVSILAAAYHTLAPPLAEKNRSAGLPAYHVEVRIADGVGAEVPRGAVGEIVTRGPHVMQGYWNQPELTAEALRGGWLHTGDLGYMDADGFIFIVDRLKDMIITGGENVYCFEVEQVILQHDDVESCAVIGIPDRKWGEAVHAIVVARAGQRPSTRGLLRHCRTRLGGYKCPRSIDIRAEPLPISASGKVAKHLLRAPYWPPDGSHVN